MGRRTIKNTELNELIYTRFLSIDAPFEAENYKFFLMKGIKISKHNGTNKVKIEDITGPTYKEICNTFILELIYKSIRENYRG